MGWTYQHEENYKTNAERIKIINEMVNDEQYDVVAAAMVGSTYYAATKNKATNEITALVVLTRIDRNSYHNFGHKWINEECCPCENHCPKKILKLLTPTQDEDSQKWRQECWENANRPKLSDINIGQTIIANGEYKLKKMPPMYQFKTPWFMDLDTEKITYFTKKIYTVGNFIMRS